MIVEHEGKKIVFVHIGGNAGTSIEWYLWCLSHGQSEPVVDKFQNGEFSHIDIIRDRYFRKAIGNPHGLLSEYPEHDISFAVIRNPYDRTLAKYFASPQSKNATNHRESFELFLEEIYSYKTAFAQQQRIHTQCQSRMLKGVNYVLEFEFVQQNMNEFCRQQDLPIIELSKSNATSHPEKSLSLYTQKGLDLVYENNKTVIDGYYDNI